MCAQWAPPAVRLTHSVYTVSATGFQSPLLHTPEYEPRCYNPSPVASIEPFEYTNTHTSMHYGSLQWKNLDTFCISRFGLGSLLSPVASCTRHVHSHTCTYKYIHTTLKAKSLQQPIKTPLILPTVPVVSTLEASPWLQGHFSYSLAGLAWYLLVSTHWWEYPCSLQMLTFKFMHSNFPACPFVGTTDTWTLSLCSDSSCWHWDSHTHI